ncbi:MAG: ABC transporter permease [Rhodospirillales bacterium]
MEAPNTTGSIAKAFDKLGRSVIALIEEMGHGGILLWQCLYWFVAGPRLGQPVRLRLIMSQMMEIGVYALPIVIIMAATIGIMQAIQGIYALGLFGAESRVGIGIDLATVREFGPLITAILVAGRSGSALAARIGTMTINQEIDALNVMGINPVRYLVAPALLAMLVMVPALSLLSMYVGLFAAGLYVQADLGISLAAYTKEAIDILSMDDLMHGLGKSVIFAVLIALIGVINGASVTGGAEGVGRVTTRSVVQSISAIVFTDMVFAFIATRI